MSDNPYQPPKPEQEPPKGNGHYPAIRGTDAMIVKSVGVLSVGKVLACLYALLGLIVGGIFSLLSLAGAVPGGPNAGPATLLLGAAAIVIFPILYGVIGFVAGVILAVLYNIGASVAGGVEVELQRTLVDRAE